MIDVTNLVKIEYHGELVLTTKQLAEFYGCTPYNIRTNFNSNIKQFEEGIHYFRLEGDQLRAFKAYVSGVIAKNSHIRNPYAPLTRLASSIILWTKAGCVRHCKMLGTPKAWEVFNLLETTYFAVLENETPPLPPLLEEPVPPLELPDNWMKQLFFHCENTTQFERILDKLIILTR